MYPWTVPVRYRMQFRFRYLPTESTVSPEIYVRHIEFTIYIRVDSSGQDICVSSRR